MTRVWSLYKTLLNVQYSWSAAKYTYLKKRQRLWEPVVIVLGLSPAIAMLVAGIVWFSDAAYRTGMMFAQPHMLLALAALAGQVMTLFFGVFYVLSSFYFSSDLSLLIPLPYKPREVLAAKLLTIMTGQYIPLLLAYVPAVVVYGVKSQAALSYWLCSVIVFVCLPVLPLIIATVLSIALMRVVNLSRRKDLWAVVGGMALTLLFIGLQFYLQYRVGDADPQELLAQLLQRADGLVESLGLYFPPSVWAAKALAYSSSPLGWWNLLLFLAVAAAAGVVLIALADRVFYQGVISGMERGRRGGAVKVEMVVGRERPVYWSLALMEIRLFMRTPGFVLNGLIGYILFPLLAIVPNVAPLPGGQDNPFILLGQAANPHVIMGGVALFFVVMSAMSMVPSTTFSREGRYLWFPRTLPLSIEAIAAGRILGAQVINVCGSLLSVIAASAVFRFPWPAVLGGSVLGVLFSTSFAGLLVILDLARPMLQWTNPIKAVKSNLNSLFAMIGAAALCFALGWGMYRLVRAGLDYLIALELLLAALLCWALYRFLVTMFAPRYWREMEG